MDERRKRRKKTISKVLQNYDGVGIVGSIWCERIIYRWDTLIYIHNYPRKSRFRAAAADATDSINIAKVLNNF